MNKRLEIILKRIPGFRSGKKNRMVIATICYLSALLIFTGIAVLAESNLPSDSQNDVQEIVYDGDQVDLSVEIYEEKKLIEDEKPISKVEDSVNEDKQLSEDDNYVDKSEDYNEIDEIQTQPTVEDETTLEVHFIDVGQGDASLLLCDGKAMLIDGGKASSSSLIYTYLEKHGVDHLDYIINTHPQEDHVGGLAGALNYATVGTVYGPMKYYDSRAFNSFLKYLDEQDVSITVPEPGETFKLASADVKILGPLQSSSNVNNNSIVLKVTHGDISFLFTGDAEREAEQDILAKEYDLNSTVLKVGHHGSNSSTTYPFLREIMPKYAVISVGSKNSYGHPTENVLSRLRDADVKTFRTDMQGDIICVSDGENVSFTVDRNPDVDTLGVVTKPTETPTPAPTSTPTVKAKPTIAPTAKPTPIPTAKPTKKPTSAPTATPAEEPIGVDYILNVNSKKIHYPNCHSVKRMNEENKHGTNMSRDELIEMGYDPCKNCNP